ncbi:hypothetical protein Psta_3603 [Pirellula staleyi DSM 6068]|uniref:Uncharacterized protein n=1 Tax=Pirellula staleyi (strain ATCC 27377 / DSM 6068 / ICPB 4128) TaxID=530564 RepID=D2QZ72_PIRSD|nr:hypothetical protein [Pirellula staleyi]ADB18264.1 hypothetical protein Psta_3603 [Pirellula staleyi DSM 6068]
MKLRLLASQSTALLLLLATGATTLMSEETKPLEIVYQDDFEKGIDSWKPMDPAQWSHKKDGDTHVISQHLKKSGYKPPHRSPTNIAILDGVIVGDLEMTVKVHSTHSDYGHRDACLVFGYQDPAHFYYVHLGKQADDHANQIFIVNDAPRTKISLTSTKGTPWTDAWHELKVVRRVADGTIEVYFDDMKTPVMTAKDEHFVWGQVGLGTFDDTADFDNLVVRGVKVEKPETPAK